MPRNVIGCISNQLRPLSSTLARPERLFALLPLGWSSGERLQLNEQVPEELAPLVFEINHLGQQIESVLVRARNSACDLGIY